MTDDKPCLRDRWVADVTCTHLLTDSVRVVLLVLARTMTRRGYVSVPRSELAKTLDRSPRRITERLTDAHRVGYLATITRGKPGVTAEYVATFPDPGAADMVRTGAPSDMVRTGAPQRARMGAPSNGASHGADGGPANTRARDLRDGTTDVVFVTNTGDVQTAVNGSRNEHGSTAALPPAVDAFDFQTSDMTARNHRRAVSEQPDVCDEQREETTDRARVMMPRMIPME